MRRIAGAVLTAVAVAVTAACGGDSGGSAGPSSAQAPSSAPPSSTPGLHSAEVVTNDGARLRITLVIGGAAAGGQGDLCAGASPAGGGPVPVTLTVLNLGDRAAPFPPVRLDTIGADGGRGERTLVRDRAGECTPFPRIPQLAAGESAVFNGSAPAGDGRIEVRISETDFLLTAPRS